MRAIAAIPGESEPQFVDVPPPPEPRPGEVLCRTLRIGLCGTDRDVVRGGRPATPPGEDFLILGHECLARVVAVGGGVESPAVGDLVVPMVRRPHDVREPFRLDFLAPSQFTERGILREHGFTAELWTDRVEFLYRVPADLGALAVLTEPFSVSEKAINEAVVIQEARLGAAFFTRPPRVLVTGTGPIGFTAAGIALAHGWPTAILGRDEPGGAKVRLAESIGIPYLQSGQTDPEEYRAEGRGFDLIIECTGSGSVLFRAARMLEYRGVLCLLGSHGDAGQVSIESNAFMFDMVVRNQVLFGAVNAAPRDFQASFEHMARLQRTHPDLLGRLITERVPVDQGLPYYSTRPRGSIKTVLEYPADQAAGTAGPRAMTEPE